VLDRSNPITFSMTRLAEAAATQLRDYVDKDDSEYS